MNERRIRSSADIHTLLHEGRINSRLTQTQVGDALGIDHANTMFCRWEGKTNQARVPPIERLTQLLDFYGYELIARRKS